MGRSSRVSVTHGVSSSKPQTALLGSSADDKVREHQLPVEVTPPEVLGALDWGRTEDLGYS